MNKDNAALLIVDLQNDFCPGGSLAVAEGDTKLWRRGESWPIWR